MCSSVAHCQLSCGCQTSTVSKPASTALDTNASNRSSNVSIGRYQLLAAVSPWFQPSVMFQSSCWATRLAPMNEILFCTFLSIDVLRWIRCRSAAGPEEPALHHGSDVGVLEHLDAVAGGAHEDAAVAPLARPEDGRGDGALPRVPRACGDGGGRQHVDVVVVQHPV